MSKKTDLIKKVVKSDVERKLTFGTDPNDPWSAKSNITEETLNETALLNRYLKSRGINPEFVSKDQKVAHSKTNQFKVWMQSHVNDPIREGVMTEPSPSQQRLKVIKQSIGKHKEIRTTGVQKQLHSEAVDKKDTVTFDIPLLIRVLEFAREELKSDILLHKLVERLISMRGKGTLTMNQYGQIVKEEFSHLTEEQINEISSKTLDSYKEKAKKSADELESKGQYKKSTDRWMNIMKATGKQIEKTTSNIKKALKKEDFFHGSAAAVGMPFDGANNPDDTIPAKKSTAKKVKLLLGGKKPVKEELYDHEKEDKPVTTPGKKTKLQKLGLDAETKESPQAAAVLSGGKTLTGEPRDTIEIDPMMKMKKQSPDSKKSV